MAPVAAVSPIVLMNAVELSAQIRGKQISCLEVMQAYLGHIDRYNPVFNAIVSLADRETLLSSAIASDADIGKGNTRDGCMASRTR
jgi:Asp-tRNA(Asn)/Glu-tRNA(Gln) amidotransferase A subunit family amidase